MEGIRVAAIIPARLASHRYPDKPLLQIQGLPMVEHVRRRALLCRGFCDVVVATCDPEIADVVERNGGKVVMTSESHPAATDRVAEAAEGIDCTHVVNVQGDEILVLPVDLERMVSALEANPVAPAWNAVGRIQQAHELSDRSVVKCTVSVSGRILFCSRDFSRLSSNVGPTFEPIRRLLGILGYRRDFLRCYGSLTRTPLETAESIDQLRILEHDVALQGVEFSSGYPGINEPRELEMVRAFLHEDSQQKAVLEKVLVQKSHVVS